MKQFTLCLLLFVIAMVVVAKNADPQPERVADVMGRFKRAAINEPENEPESEPEKHNTAVTVGQSITVVTVLALASIKFVW